MSVTVAPRPQDLEAELRRLKFESGLINGTLDCSIVNARPRDLESELNRLKHESALINANAAGPPAASPRRTVRSASVPPRAFLDGPLWDAEYFPSQQRAAYCEDRAFTRWAWEKELQEEADVKMRSVLRCDAYNRAKLQQAAAVGDLRLRQYLEQHDLQRRYWNDAYRYGIEDLELMGLNRRMRGYNMPFGVGWNVPYAPDEYGWYMEEQRQRLLEERLENNLDFRLGIGRYRPGDRAFGDFGPALGSYSAYRPLPLRVGANYVPALYSPRSTALYSPRFAHGGCIGRRW